MHRGPGDCCEAILAMVTPYNTYCKFNFLNIIYSYLFDVTNYGGGWFLWRFPGMAFRHLLSLSDDDRLSSVSSRAFSPPVCVSWFSIRAGCSFHSSETRPRTETHLFLLAAHNLYDWLFSTASAATTLFAANAVCCQCCHISALTLWVIQTERLFFILSTHGVVNLPLGLHVSLSICELIGSRSATLKQPQDTTCTQIVQSLVCLTSNGACFFSSGLFICTMLYITLIY